jgi:hypothetical protein
MGCDCGPLRRRHSGEGRGVPERCSSFLRFGAISLLQPTVLVLGGVIHERDLSIKQDKERAESGDGP